MTAPSGTTTIAASSTRPRSLCADLAPVELRNEGRPALERAEVLAAFDAKAVVATLRANEELVAILEDSIWTPARVARLANDLLQRIAELQAMLAAMGVHRIAPSTP